MTNILKSSVDINKTSLTVKALVASLIPVVKILFGIEIVGEQADQVIDAIFVLATTGIALYGYARAKYETANKIEALGANIRSLRHTLESQKEANISPSSSD